MTTSIAHPAETAGGIQWHPGLYSATERELRENKKGTKYDPEKLLKDIKYPIEVTAA